MARKIVTVENGAIEQAQPVDVPVAAPLASTTPPKQRSGFLGGALFGIFTAGAGFAAAQYWPLNSSVAPSQDIVQMQTDFAAIKALIALPTATDPALIARMEALETGLQSLAVGPDLTDVSARVAALENRPQTNADDLTALQSQISDLKSQMNPVDAAAMVKTAIAAELDGVASAAADLRDQTLKAAKSAETAAAIGLLRAALDTGAPFAALTSLPNFPAVLAKHAATGLPSLGTLKSDFPNAARAALEAALSANMGETWSERVTSFMRNQTGARALSPREGSDPDAVLSRVEAALNAADLQAALMEITNLPAPAQTAIADWTARTQLRQTAIDAVNAFAKAGE